MIVVNHGLKRKSWLSLMHLYKDMSWSYIGAIEPEVRDRVYREQGEAFAIANELAGNDKILRDYLSANPCEAFMTTRIMDLAQRRGDEDKTRID